MITDKIGYAYSDLTIVPTVISSVYSRKDCDCMYNHKYLPIFASCMDTIVNIQNQEIFESNGIIPIIPRNINIEDRKKCIFEGKWVALSLHEFSLLFIDEYKDLEIGKTYKICIDIANGHMEYLYNMCKVAKKVSVDNGYTLIIMTGNIANPMTYNYICENMTYKDSSDNNKCVIDYIRVGIGGGLGCTTASNTGTFYPMASLIEGCYKFKEFHKHNCECPKIIADGGIRNYNDVNKALALGADYVMIGALFAGMYESASPLLIKTDEGYINSEYEYTNEDKKRLDIRNRNLYKEFYGMSTKKAQIKIGNKELKTAEGRCTYERVQYTLAQWCDNMKSYLRSAMSYQGAKTLVDFIGKPTLIINSPGAVMSVNK